MPFFSRNGRGQAPAQISRPRAEPFTSLGLHALFQCLKPETKYSILDLGSGTGPTIEFLIQYSSRIRVEDLYNTLSQRGFFDPRDQPVDRADISGMLSIPEAERFDIILCWDLLNYFRQEELAALVGYLNGFCRPGTLFFAFCSTRREMPALPLSYKIQDSETLLYCTASAEMRTCPRFTPRELTLLLSDFSVHSSYILRNGMQEYLFVHR